jgi:hypothetical protein
VARDDALSCAAVLSFGMTEADGEITYGDFIELISAMADAVYSLDVDSSLLEKIHMLFFVMSDSGAKFQKREYKVFQTVRRLVKQTLKCVLRVVHTLHAVPFSHTRVLAALTVLHPYRFVDAPRVAGRRTRTRRSFARWRWSGLAPASRMSSRRASPRGDDRIV